MKQRLRRANDESSKRADERYSSSALDINRKPLAELVVPNCFSYA